MGLLSPTEYHICLLLIEGLASVFLGWVLVAVYKTTASLTVSGSHTQRQEQVLCPCVFEDHCTAMQLTTSCTVATVFFFWLYNVSGALFGVAHFAVCHWPCVTMVALYHVGSASLILGFALMYVTHFERLRLTFSGSSMALPQWAPNVLYGTTLFGIALFAASVVTLWTVGPSVAALFLVLLIVWHFATVSALIRAFYKKTMAVALSGHRCDISLVETAVRITVVVTTSLLATMFTTVCAIAKNSVCPNCRFWLLICVTIIVLDTCLSGFCLLCTFARTEGHYKQVFGKMHCWFLSRAMDDGIEDIDEIDITRLPST